MEVSLARVFILIQIILSLVQYAYFQEAEKPLSLLVLSVGTDETDGYKRYVRSLKQYGFDYEILGMGEEWRGGNVKVQAGGGHKVNLLKSALEKYKNDDSKVILFTDSYDVILTQNVDEVMKKFKAFDSRIVFGAEKFCWPDQSLADDYPVVPENEMRFLNSGAFIGYASDLYDIVSSSEIQDTDDDQLFYTKIFLNIPTRAIHNMKLDTKSEIIQNLNGASQDLSLFAADNGEIGLYNNLTQSTPAVIHGNGASKMILNRLGNYLGKAYDNGEGCVVCNEDTIKLSEEVNEWPEVTVAIFVEQPSPFLREFFKKVSKLNYPKNKLSVLIHNNVKYHNAEVEKFFTNSNNEYSSIKYISPNDDSLEHEARREAIEECIKNNCNYYFSLDSTVHLDNADTLKLLIEQNRSILSPVMIRKGTTWSNVWGAVNEKGYYLRSDDYLDITNRNFVGVWNLPYVSEAYLINGQVLKKIPLEFEDEFLEPSIAFAAGLRKADIFMYGTNREEFGHLITPDSFNTSKIRPELYEIFSNFDDWTERYIHPEFEEYVSGNKSELLPCPDVYWFPIITDEFCEDLIATVEDFGQWSGGKNNNYDPRIPGGYENVPTVDIHMTQVGFQEHWLQFLRKFVQRIQRKVFIGYFHDPPQASLNFVVRYRPGEQDHLTPHHDASTYTMNIALNIPDVDFQGGGVRFVRYNCNVTHTKKGWAMIHPGRLTHYHEGLKVTGGTRYIMVSFIDP